VFLLSALSTPRIRAFGAHGHWRSAFGAPRRRAFGATPWIGGGCQIGGGWPGTVGHRGRGPSSTNYFSEPCWTPTVELPNTLPPSLLLAAVSTCIDVGSARIPKGERNRWVHVTHTHALVTQLNVDTCKECRYVQRMIACAYGEAECHVMYSVSTHRHALVAQLNVHICKICKHAPTSCGYTHTHAYV